MKLKPFINTYGWPKVKCPFCTHTSSVKDTSKSSPDALRDLKRHITNQSKNEALSYVLGEGSKTKHLDYYKVHTEDRPMVLTSTKRQFDNDLALSEEK